MRKKLGLLFVTMILALSGCSHPPPSGSQTVQHHVHHMSPMVMPFDMAKTLHIFKMSEQGGTLQVIVRDPQWTEQVALIRLHLKHEAMEFQQGNYSDPATLHGGDMPGLKELMQGAVDIKVSYQDITDGGEINFETNDLHLLTAIHRWFGAQLSEHGADAKSEQL